MNNTEPIFEYQYTFRFFRVIGVWAMELLVAGLPVIIFSFIMGTIIGNALSGYLCYTVYLLIAVILAIRVARPAIMKVRLEQEKLIWHESRNHKLEVERSQITELQVGKKAWVFKSAGEAKKFKVYGLPQKEQWILAYRLMRWVPESALPNETFNDLQTWRKARQALMENLESKTVVASSSYQYTFFFHSLITACLLLLLTVTIYSIYQEGLPVFLLALFLWAIPILIALLLWEQTSYRTFQVESAGVRYTQDHQQIFWPWKEIEVAELNLPRREIKLWRDNRYKRVSLHRMNGADLAQALEYWQQNMLVRNIPLVWLDYGND